MGLFDKITASFKKLGATLGITTVITEDYYDELEEQLITADVGMQTALEIVSKLKRLTKERGVTETSAVMPILKEIVSEMMKAEKPFLPGKKPHVIMMIGVNGVGKTTTIGKLATKLKSEGNRVVLAAADTFRAAAVEQLVIWGERSGCEVIAHAQGSDPAAVVFDAITAGVARNADYIICDTAGRLHNKKNLMDELSKISRIIKRELPDSEAEVLLVVDATTGQNALSQARLFKEAADITGIVLTKLDGTAKGGVVIGIMQEVGVPVRFVGLGEGKEDIAEFSAEEFSDALFGDNK